MRDAGADGSEWWILWMSSSVSSRSTASVSELSRLVTHIAVSSPQYNSKKRDPSLTVLHSERYLNDTGIVVFKKFIS